MLFPCSFQPSRRTLCPRFIGRTQGCERLTIRSPTRRLLLANISFCGAYKRRSTGSLSRSHLGRQATKLPCTAAIRSMMLKSRLRQPSCCLMALRRLFAVLLRLLERLLYHPLFSLSNSSHGIKWASLHHSLSPQGGPAERSRVVQQTRLS